MDSVRVTPFQLLVGRYYASVLPARAIVIPSHRSLLVTAALGLAVILGVALMGGGVARGASPPTSRALAGVGACALIEGVPGPRDPIRRVRPFRAAFAALDKAGSRVSSNRAAYARFDRALDALMVRARRTFHPSDGELRPKIAQGFLERYVFGQRAVLRIGLERFEPRTEIATAMALAACRAGLDEALIQLARRVSGSEGAPLRAIAALLLLDHGRRAEATELAAHLGEGGFIGPWVGAELSDDPAERRRLHAIAARHISTPDQQTALAEQRQRYGLR